MREFSSSRITFQIRDSRNTRWWKETLEWMGDMFGAAKGMLDMLIHLAYKAGALQHDETTGSCRFRLWGDREGAEGNIETLKILSFISLYHSLHFLCSVFSSLRFLIVSQLILFYYLIALQRTFWGSLQVQTWFPGVLRSLHVSFRLKPRKVWVNGPVGQIKLLLSHKTGENSEWQPAGKHVLIWQQTFTFQPPSI